MPKLTIHSTAGNARPKSRGTAPSAPDTTFIADPNTFMDARGRTIKVRELSALDQMRLLRYVGDENVAYFTVCMDVSRVQSIDDRTFDVPSTRIDMEHVVQVLANDGMAALTAHLHPAGGAENSDLADGVE